MRSIFERDENIEQALTQPPTREEQLLEALLGARATIEKQNEVLKKLTSTPLAVATVVAIAAKPSIVRPRSAIRKAESSLAILNSFSSCVRVTPRCITCAIQGNVAWPLISKN